MREYVQTPNFYDEYISHHGVLGQKWGKKNGPPYPLDSKVSTGKRLKNIGSVKKKKIDKKDKDAINQYRDQKVKYYNDRGDKDTAKIYKNAPDELIKEELKHKQNVKKALIVAGTVIGLSAAAYIIYKRKTVNDFSISKNFITQGSKDSIGDLVQKGLNIDVANKVMDLSMSGRIVDDSDLIDVIKDGIMNDMNLTLHNATFKRVDFHKNFDLDKVKNPLFVTMTKYDSDLYKGILPNRVGSTGQKHQIVFNALTQVKVPSKKETEKILKTLMQSDPSLDDELLKAYTHIIKNNTGITDQNLIKSTLKQVRSINGDSYAIITALGGSNEILNQKISKVFKDSGYNALLDLHDVVDDLSDLPLIILDKEILNVKEKIKL